MEVNVSDKRRQQLLDRIRRSSAPITGSDLADKFNVSRQVIVQDIALIRASGIPIIATSSGYMLQKKMDSNRVVKTFVSTHNDFDQMEEELLIIVDFGGKIIDVIVEHPVYGEIVGALYIETREDVLAFIKKVKETGAKPLSILTSGDHIHTIEVPSERVFSLLMQELKDKGFVSNDYM